MTTVTQTSTAVTISTETNPVTASVTIGGSRGTAGQGVPDGGATNQVLTKLSADDYDTVWANQSSGFADPMTTRGDLIIKDADNTTTRLAIGSNGQVLMSDGTDVSWGDVSAANIDGGSF